MRVELFIELAWMLHEFAKVWVRRVLEDSLRQALNFVCWTVASKSSLFQSSLNFLLIVTFGILIELVVSFDVLFQ